MLRRSFARVVTTVAVFGSCVHSAWTLEPPTREQKATMLRDGSLAARAAAALEHGNHSVAPSLASRIFDLADAGKRELAATAKVFPSTGSREVFALLIEFSDHRGSNAVSDFDRRLFGFGPAAEFPYESLREFYRRSSYGQLDIDGETLGWYTYPSSRNDVSETTSGRESLIREAIEYFDRRGHDFSQYDTDGDGFIDYFLVFWAGPHQDWAEFWWGYQRYYENDNFTVDGKRLGAYSWQWESWDVGGPFSARVAIHETGHALGLPDYYDYEDTIGPMGGLGGLDMMDHNWGDHNAFSKYLLGWLTPGLFNEGSNLITLRAGDLSSDAALMMHGAPQSGPYGEFFIAQHRKRGGNDSDYPNDGLLIWHVDARINDRGMFLCDNSYSDHKLIRMMEADGLEQIEQGLPADAGDFYRPGHVFDELSTPTSDRYDGTPTSLVVDDITESATTMSFRADLGLGCALFCEANVPVTAWPGYEVLFAGIAGPSNCEGVPTFDWQMGDGSGFGTDSTRHAFGVPATYQWALQTALGSAWCAREGEVLVCTDERCWQWRRRAAMENSRVMHAAVALADGRVLVAGGEGTPEIYDPGRQSWTPTGPISGAFYFAQGVLLEDGRVLVVGSTPGDPINAEIYDPESDTWLVTGQMARQRTFHSLQRLADGRVMAAGGHFWDSVGDMYGVREVEIFDPETGSWHDAGELVESTLLPGITPLADGSILVTANQSAQLFFPDSENWARTTDLSYSREYHVALGLRDGRVMVAGGLAPSLAAEIFDPATRTWFLTEPMSSSRNSPAAWLDDSGRVFLAGGFDQYSRVLATTEMYDPASGKWMLVAPMSQHRLAHGASRLEDGTVLITGGMPTLDVEPYEGTSSVEIFRSPMVGVPPRSAGRRVGR